MEWAIAGTDLTVLLGRIMGKVWNYGFEKLLYTQSLMGCYMGT